MALCYSCIGSGKATPRRIPDADCPRCGGSGQEPGAGGLPASPRPAVAAVVVVVAVVLLTGAVSGRPQLAGHALWRGWFLTACPVCGLSGGPFRLPAAETRAGTHDDRRHGGEPTTEIFPVRRGVRRRQSAVDGAA